MYNVLSLGAGVQSSTLALMASSGEFEMPDFAVFADTQSEPESVYSWLKWLDNKLPFPVYRVTVGSLGECELSLRTSKKTELLHRAGVTPFFTVGLDGNVGMLNRGCTRDYKVKPIEKFVREKCGITRGQKHVSVTQWIGISLDEMTRAKPSRNAWSQHRWPLIEKRMTRRACLEWMENHGYPQPPRSACVFCPFHSNKEWRRLQQEEPDEFAKAVEFEQQLNAVVHQCETTKAIRVTMHPSGKFITDVDLRTDVERGQGVLWDDECEGMCGV